MRIRWRGLELPSRVIADMETFILQSPKFARVDARLLLAEGYHATNQVEMAM